MGVPYWAKVRHEDVWTHFHPWWMGVEHTAVSWINRSTRRIVGKTVGEMTQELLDTIGWMTVVGGLMIIAGIAILIPGPVDVLVFTLGLLGGALGCCWRPGCLQSSWCSTDCWWIGYDLL